MSSTGMPQKIEVIIFTGIIPNLIPEIDPRNLIRLGSIVRKLNRSRLYRPMTDALRKIQFVKVIGLLREQFSSGANYKERVLKWDTVIERKAMELARFLVGKSSALVFTEPAPRRVRNDGWEMRAKILALTASEAKQAGIGNSTLHYLRARAFRGGSLHVYRRVRNRLLVGQRAIQVPSLRGQCS
jgi:hypothetical protein